MKGELENDFTLNVCQSKLKRAKRIILEKLEGSFIDEYNKLKAYAQEIRSSNPGSDVVINIPKNALAEGKMQFLRMYLSFDALKKGWKCGLRPLIGVDGTFLKGRCKGMLLVALGQDSMNSFYPLAWAIVDKETSRTWS
ncbi:putative F-box protein-like [Capsicum annuum]|nr:putative F-box protein-like [Capsicum annuum]